MMNILTTLKKTLGLAPPPAAPTAPAPPTTIRNVIYESASQGGRRSRTWPSPTTGANDGVLPYLAVLRARARAAVRNHGYPRAAIDRLVSNIVGTGIVPQSQAPDPAFRDAVAQAWLRWTDEANADGVLDFYGTQALAVRVWLESGECFVRLRARLASDGLSVPLQLQLIEPEFCPVQYNAETLAGTRVRAGIEFDGIGRRIAYYFYPQRPGAWQDLDITRLGRLDAARVAHLYEPVRAGQIRGVPHLTQALIKLRDLDAYDDATLLRQQLSNLFVGFLTRQSEGDPAVSPLTGGLTERDNSGNAMVGLEPGIFQELRAGEDVKFADPPEAQGYAEFMRGQLMGAAVAADVPYEVLTGDMRDVNDRTVRVILHEFRRRVEQRQQHVVAYQLCRPIWEAWFDAARMSGAITLPDPGAYSRDPDAWRRVEWTAPAWPYLHPVQDAEAERAMIRSGFKSRTQVAKERGYDVEALDREIAADNARADRLGLKFDSDGRQPSTGGGTAPGLLPGVKSVKEVERDPKTRLITGVTERHIRQEG